MKIFDYQAIVINCTCCWNLIWLVSSISRWKEYILSSNKRTWDWSYCAVLLLIVRSISLNLISIWNQRMSDSTQDILRSKSSTSTFVWTSFSWVFLSLIAETDSRIRSKRDEERVSSWSFSNNLAVDVGLSKCNARNKSFSPKVYTNQRDVRLDWPFHTWEGLSSPDSGRKTERVNSNPLFFKYSTNIESATLTIRRFDSGPRWEGICVARESSANNFDRSCDYSKADYWKFSTKSLLLIFHGFHFDLNCQSAWIVILKE